MKHKNLTAFFSRVVTVLLPMLLAMTAQTAWAQTNYNINVQPYLEGVGGASCGSVIASPQTAQLGEVVTLTARPASGYGFKEWKAMTPGVTFADQYSEQTTFAMLEGDVIIEAVFMKTFMVRGIATPASKGKVEVSKDNENWSQMIDAKEGDMIYYKATAAPGSKTDGSLSIEVVNDPTTVLSGNPFTMPASNVNVTIGFMTDPYAAVPSNIFSVTVSPTLYMFAGNYFNGSPMSSASVSENSGHAGNVVTLTATPSYLFGEQFISWYVSNNAIIADPWSPTTTLVIPSGNTTVSPYFCRDYPFFILRESEGFNVSMASGFKNQSAKYERTFTQDVSSTLCLPIDYSETKDNGTYYEFGGVNRETNPWTVTMTAVVTPQLGKPYLFVPSVSGGQAFQGKISYDFENPSATSTPSYQEVADATTGGTWRLVGTYSPIEWTEGHEDLGTVYGFAAMNYNSGSYTVSPGDFVKAMAGASISPFRAYLKYTPPAGVRTRGEAEVLPNRIVVRLVDSDGHTTSLIPNLKPTDEGSGFWYSIDGRRLSGQPTKKGVYIHNGRKEVIR